jgi:hypothetical protein
MKINVGNWIIDAIEDDDGHLTIGLNHEDGSKVIQVEEDVTANNTEWGDRFTTESIEGAFERESMNFYSRWIRYNGTVVT